jgi:hypothetical protein
MSRKVQFLNAKYLGRLPGSKERGGSLLVNDECLGMGRSGSPKKALVRWDEMAGISFENKQGETAITVTRMDGNAAIYQIDGEMSGDVRLKLQSFLIDHGVKCLDDVSVDLDALSHMYGYAEYGHRDVTRLGWSTVEPVRDDGVLEIKVRSLTVQVRGFTPATEVFGTSIWLYENGIRFDITTAESGTPNWRGFVPWPSIFAIGTRPGRSGKQELQIQYLLGPSYGALLAMKIAEGPLGMFFDRAGSRLRAGIKILRP